MKKTYLGLLAMGSALSLSLMACGDDIINVENTTAFTTVETLDSLECNKDTDGFVAFETSTRKMFSCSNGEWTPIDASEAIDYRCKAETLKDSTGYNIICDGEKIGTITNGKDGKDGEKGDAGESGEKGDKGDKGSKGKDGEPATEVNVDSLSNAISDTLTDKLTETIIDSLSCRIDSSWTDSLKSMINVKIVCGEGESVIELPTLIPSKNLTNVYKRTIVMKYPARFSYVVNGLTTPIMRRSSNEAEVIDILDPEYFYDCYSGSDECRGMINSNLAKVTIMELDEKINQTGKSFISDLTTMNNPSIKFVKDSSYMDIDDNYSNSGKMEMISESQDIVLSGDISVTNLANPIVQIRIEFNGQAVLDYNKNESSKVVYNAIVDLDNEDTIFVDFLTDYKAARVKELVNNGTKYTTANVQANKELAVAFGLDENTAMFEVLQTKDQNVDEFYAHNMWPVILSYFSDKRSTGENDYIENSLIDHNQVYQEFKNNFAQNGNFKKSSKINHYRLNHYYGELIKNEQTIYLVDLFAQFHTENFNELNSSPIAFKFVQNGLKEAYDLPECNENLSSNPYAIRGEKNGLYEAFRCNTDAEIWDISYYIAGLMLSSSSVTDTILGKCEKDNQRDTIYNITSGYDYKKYDLIFICSETPNGMFRIMNFGSENDEEDGLKMERLDLCDDPNNEGTYFLSQMGSGAEAYKCKCSEDKGCTAFDVDEYEYHLKKECTESLNDSVFYVTGKTYNDFSWQSEYSLWVVCKSTENGSTWEEASINEIAKKQFGKCTEKKQGTTKSIEINLNGKRNIVCDNGEWRTVSSNLEVELGVCNEEVLNKNEIKKMDYDESSFGQLHTYMQSFKCVEKFYEDEAIYYWTELDYMEKKLGKICNKNNIGETITLENGKVICSESGWLYLNEINYCKLYAEEIKVDSGDDDEDEYNNQESSNEPDYTHICEYENYHYVSQSKNSYYWTSADTYCKDYGATCNDKENYCACTFINKLGDNFIGYVKTPNDTKYRKATDENDFCNTKYHNEVDNGEFISNCQFNGDTYFIAHSNATVKINGKEIKIEKNKWYTTQYARVTYYCGECTFTGDEDQCIEEGICPTNQNGSCNTPFSEFAYDCMAGSDIECAAYDDETGDCHEKYVVKAYWESQH